MARRREKRAQQPFGWIDDSEMRRAEHPLAVVGRAVAVLHWTAFGQTGQQNGWRVFEGLAEAIETLAKHREYDALGWLLYGLEELVEEGMSDERPLPGCNTDVPEAYKAAEV